MKPVTAFMPVSASCFPCSTIPVATRFTRVIGDCLRPPLERLDVDRDDDRDDLRVLPLVERRDPLLDDEPLAERDEDEPLRLELLRALPFDALLVPRDERPLPRLLSLRPLSPRPLPRLLLPRLVLLPDALRLDEPRPDALRLDALRLDVPRLDALLLDALRPAPLFRPLELEPLFPDDDVRAADLRRDDAPDLDVPLREPTLRELLRDDFLSAMLYSGTRVDAIT